MQRFLESCPFKIVSKALGSQVLCPNNGYLASLGRNRKPRCPNCDQQNPCSPDLPDSLLPVALQAATSVALNLPQRQIILWLEQEATIIRALAFTLIQAASPPLNFLETGITDPDASVRRAALVPAGNIGHHGARAGLLAQFGRNPRSQIIWALLAVVNEEIIVRTGRLCPGKTDPPRSHHRRTLRFGRPQGVKNSETYRYSKSQALVLTDIP